MLQYEWSGGSYYHNSFMSINIECMRRDHYCYDRLAKRSWKNHKYVLIISRLNNILLVCSRLNGFLINKRLNNITRIWALVINNHITEFFPYNKCIVSNYVLMLSTI